MRRSLKKLCQKGEKQSQNPENLHKAIYVSFQKKKFLSPTKGLLIENSYFELPKNLAIFKGNFSVIVVRYYKNFPQLSTSFKFKATNFTVATKPANL